MINCAKPAEVFSFCDASGKIKPLRLRIEDRNGKMVQILIDRVIGYNEIQHIGAESQIFLCRGTVGNRIHTFQLQYWIRRHNWSIHFTGSEY